MKRVTIEVYCVKSRCPWFEDCQGREKSILVGPHGGVIHCTEFGGEYNVRMEEPARLAGRVGSPSVHKSNSPLTVPEAMVAPMSAKCAKRLAMLSSMTGKDIHLHEISMVIRENLPVTASFLRTLTRKGMAVKVCHGTYMIGPPDTKIKKSN